jgi:transposase
MKALLMSRKERQRLEVFSRVKRGEITIVRAAGWLKISERQAHRIYRRFVESKDAGLVHLLRGRRSNRRLAEATRTKVIGRYQERYADFGPTHACEKLLEDDGLKVSADTLSRLLKEAGIWKPLRRGRKHRSRRERRSCFGEMVQMDGSVHDWFEGRGKRCVLMDLVDDATGRTHAKFFAEETTVAAFESFGEWIKQYGVPRSVYVDRDSIYRSARQASVEEELADEAPLTQFGRAMKDLGVTLIMAHSPQAKGRVERKNRTLQDRLVKELRLAGVSTMEAANLFLSGTFLAKLNARQTVKARDKTNAHRRLARGTKLEQILCFAEQRTVGQDWCVRYQSRWFQIDPMHQSLQLASKQITVRRLLAGTIELLHGRTHLTFVELLEAPNPVKVKKPIVNNKVFKPTARQQPPAFGRAART